MNGFVYISLVLNFQPFLSTLQCVCLTNVGPDVSWYVRELCDVIMTVVWAVADGLFCLFYMHWHQKVSHALCQEFERSRKLNLLVARP